MAYLSSHECQTQYNIYIIVRNEKAKMQPTSFHNRFSSKMIVQMLQKKPIQH